MRAVVFHAEELQSGEHGALGARDVRRARRSSRVPEESQPQGEAQRYREEFRAVWRGHARRRLSHSSRREPIRGGGQPVWERTGRSPAPTARAAFPGLGRRLRAPVETRAGKTHAQPASSTNPGIEGCLRESPDVAERARAPTPRLARRLGRPFGTIGMLTGTRASVARPIPRRERPRGCVHVSPRASREGASPRVSILR